MLRFSSKLESKSTNVAIAFESLVVINESLEALDAIFYDMTNAFMADDSDVVDIGIPPNAAHDSGEVVEKH